MFVSVCSSRDFSDSPPRDVVVDVTDDFLSDQTDFMSTAPAAIVITGTGGVKDDCC